MLTWVSSYPRSGNRLVREIIHYLENGTGMFKDTVPDYHELGNIGPSPYCKIHSLYDNLPKIDCKIIYILRNPFDVLNSAINYLKNFDKKKISKNFIKNFASQNGYIEDWKKWGSYRKHASSFLLSRKLTINNLLIVQYENLIIEKSREVRRIAHFINKKVTEDKINEILVHTNFKFLKSKEPLNIVLNKGKIINLIDNIDHNEVMQITDFYQDLLNEVKIYRSIDLKKYIYEN